MLLCALSKARAREPQRHKFQIVPQDTLVATDVILGCDFLQKFHCNIDYYTYTLNINVRNNNYSLPITENTIQHIHIPARSEIMVPYRIHILQVSVVCNRQITSGTITPAKGNKHIKLLNVNCYPISKI